MDAGGAAARAGEADVVWANAAGAASSTAISAAFPSRRRPTRTPTLRSGGDEADVGRRAARGRLAAVLSGGAAARRRRGAALVAGADGLVGAAARRAGAVGPPAGVHARGRVRIAAERLTVSAGEARAHAADATEHALGVARAGVAREGGLLEAKAVGDVAGVRSVLARGAMRVVLAVLPRQRGDQRL